ncbi:putative PIF1 DNA helicase/replication protein A1-like protein [Tanacetum coccineum]|uniref:PIF1 DNA helicase/replication protein A1-like protein n=1 Tax=Tanacetum coccineum TaxID=301880 RepID=A0ABQ4ZWD1_9ASTR
MKEIPVIVLSNDDSVETKAKQHKTLLKKGRIGNNNDVYMSFLDNKKVSAITNKKLTGKEFQNIKDLETNAGNPIGFNNNQKKELCSVSKSTTKNLIDEPTDDKFNEYENFNEDFVSLFDEEANDDADSKAETLTKATTEFAKAKDGTHKNTNKRKANAIPDMIPTNAKPLVDLSIRNTSRPVTRQPMTQGATTSRKDTLYRGNSTLVESDMQNLKGKMVTRQSLRKMNSTQPQRKDYLNHGDPTFPCESCGALLWHAETLRRATNALDQSYSICCSRGKVKLGGKVDNTVNYGRGPFCYCIHKFRMVGERIKSSNDQRLKLRLIGTRNQDERQYNLPTTSEVAPLIVGDLDNTKNKRDIILLQQDSDLKRISELHPQYLAIQYPLFFPYAKDGYCTDIFYDGVTNYDEKNKGTRVTMKEWFSYRVQERENEFLMMLNERRLFQQFLVDGYTMIEAERMSFNRKQQKDLRSETYSKLAKLAEDPKSGV